MISMLIIPYIITLACLLTNMPSVVFAGMLLGTCFIPGITCYLLLKDDNLSFADLALSFPVSIGLSSLLILISLWLNINIRYTGFVVIGASLLFMLFAIIKRKNRGLPGIIITLDERRFVGIALIAILIFSIPVFSVRVTISHHGFHHFSLVTNILNGFFPPENPGIGGEPIGYHWGYHAFVASLSSSSNINPLRIFSILNIISLFIIFCIAYSCARIYNIPARLCYIAPIALTGLMRSDAIFYFLRNMIRGSFPVIESDSSAPLKLLSQWVWGVSFLDTRLFFLNKFYNANNMPLGLCFLFSFFMIVLMLLGNTGEKKPRTTLLILMSLTLTGLALNYAFFLIIPLLMSPVWAVIYSVAGRRANNGKIRDFLRFLTPCIIAALFSAPYLLAVASGGNVVTAGKDLDEFRFLYLDIQAVRNLVVFLLPSPFIIYGFWILYRRYDLSGKSLFLFSGTLLTLFLSVFLRLNWANSAKFSFVLSFFFLIPVLMLIEKMLERFTGTVLQRILFAGVSVYLLFTPLLTEAAYISSPWFIDKTYAFDGRHIVFNKEKTRNEAYQWIRNNTPHDALILLPFFATPHAPGGVTIAQAFSYRPSALAERSLFVIRDVYALVTKEFENRAAIRDILFNTPGDDRVRKYLKSLKRPVYLLTEEGYRDDELVSDVEMDNLPESADDFFKTVFKTGKQTVYKIEYNKI